MYALVLVLVFIDGSSEARVVDTGLTKFDCLATREVLLKEYSLRESNVYDKNLYCEFQVNF